MNSFLFALQFLTIFPVRIKTFDEEKFAKSMFYFPVIGLLLAVILIGINNFLLFTGFNSFVSSVVVVVALVIFTGGLHLDGLSDTFDALSSGKDKEKMLEIMHDSHCGVMGILSIICIILLKISFLSSIAPAHKTGAIILMCVFGRCSMVFLIFSFPYARSQGKAAIFSQRINPKMVIVTTFFSLVCAIIIFKATGFIIIAIALFAAFIFGKLISKKINGITGDVLGAANELVEVVVLLTVCILERSGLSWIM